MSLIVSSNKLKFRENTSSTWQGLLLQGEIDVLDLVYPVGSIYMSVNSTSPATLFGGTWEQIADRFLLAAGSSYAAGSTGGEATHTLTTTELPYNDIPSGNEAGGYGLAATPAFQDRPMIMQYGGGQAHNNMPPYLAVYVWKRTA